MNWNQIRVPPALMQSKHSGQVTGVTKLEDSPDSLLLILEFENVIAEIFALAYNKEVVLAQIEKSDNEKT